MSLDYNKQQHFLGLIQQLPLVQQCHLAPCLKGIANIHIGTSKLRVKCFKNLNQNIQMIVIQIQGQIIKIVSNPSQKDGKANQQLVLIPMKEHLDQERTVIKEITDKRKQQIINHLIHTDFIIGLNSFNKCKQYSIVFHVQNY
ncbi:hypothetical protein pb186bvf_016639 [Paramecium bursaria]